jgi:hypothetical protein
MVMADACVVVRLAKREFARAARAAEARAMERAAGGRTVAAESGETLESGGEEEVEWTDGRTARAGSRVGPTLCSGPGKLK